MKFLRAYIPIFFEDLLQERINAKFAIAVTKNFCAQFIDENDMDFIEDCAFTQASLQCLLNMWDFTNEQDNNFSSKFLLDNKTNDLNDAYKEIFARVIVSVDLNENEYIEDNENVGKVYLQKPIEWKNISCIHVEDVENIELVANCVQEMKKTFKEKPDFIDYSKITTFDFYTQLDESSLLWFDKSERELIVDIMKKSLTSL